MLLILLGNKYKTYRYRWMCGMSQDAMTCCRVDASLSYREGRLSLSVTLLASLSLWNNTVCRLGQDLGWSVVADSHKSAVLACIIKGQYEGQFFFW